MSNYYAYEEVRYGSGYRITRAVQRLILANIVMFAAQLLLDIPLGLSGAPPGGVLTEWLAFQPGALLAGGVWKPLTYMFLHANLWHILFNMLWLFFFGPDVERVLGTRQFYWFYLLCGALGVLATFVPVILFGGSMSVTGASGAVMGVLVAYAMVNPEREFFLFPLPIPLNARALVFIVIVLNVLTAFQGGNTSVATHFGGMAVGFLLMKYIPVLRRWQREFQNRKRPPKPKKPDSGDRIGEAVDNIFNFEDRRRRR